MRIADMEIYHDDFICLDKHIWVMVCERCFPDVFSECEASYPYLEPAIRYRMKRDIKPITPPISAFTVICRYAPALFEHRVIESFSSFIGSSRFWSKHENNYRQAADMAFECEEVARKLWNLLERENQVSRYAIQEYCGGNKEMVDMIVNIWDHLGIVLRKTNGEEQVLQLYTRLNDVVEGVCIACGVRGKGEKRIFLKCKKCGRCGATGRYHFTGVEMA